MVEDVAVLVGTDVGVDQPELAVLHQTVGIFQVRAPGANRLDLGAAQGDAGLKFFQQKVVVRRGPILTEASRSPLATGSRRPAGFLAGAVWV